MAQAYHVNGPAVIMVGIGAGTPPALVQLGISEDGVDIVINEKLNPLTSDASGGEAADFQRVPTDATVSFRLVAYDMVTLQNIRRKQGAAGAVVDGIQSEPGRLVGTNGDTFKLVIMGNDEPWRFFYCVPRATQRVKLSSKYTGWDVSLFAWTFVPGSATTVAGLGLYDHTPTA